MEFENVDLEQEGEGEDVEENLENKGTNEIEENGKIKQITFTDEHAYINIL